MKELEAEVYIIVAMTKDHIIGKGEGLPWRIPEEMDTFKRLTAGNTVIMGRKTYQTIGHPLHGRNNIVISKTLTPVEGLQITSNLDDALVIGRSLKKKIFILGGAEVYKAALTIAEYMYVSWIHGHYDGDVRFPDFNQNLWLLLKEQIFEKFTLSLYSRQQNRPGKVITNVD